MRNLNFIFISLLFLSGLSITISGAVLSINGILLFIQDNSLFYMILMLAISFEVAKIVASTFLFHKFKDKLFPLTFKLILLTSVFFLILISNFATYVHLNNSVKKSLVVFSTNTIEITSINKTLLDLEKRKTDIETQIQNLPTTSVKGRIKLYNAYNLEKDSILKDINTNKDKLLSLEKGNVSEDRFSFLDELSSTFSLEKKSIILIFLMSLSFLIDPLAITLLLASSYIFSSYIKEELEKKIPIEVVDNKLMAQKDEIVETPIVEELIEEPLVEELIEESSSQLDLEFKEPKKKRLNPITWFGIKENDPK